jgi:hypothetical protein
MDTNAMTVTTIAHRNGVWAQILASIYHPFLWLGERAGMRSRRAELLGQACGRVLEIGAGTGLNLAHYNGGGEELILSEPEEPMAKRLETRIQLWGRLSTEGGSGPAPPLECGEVRRGRCQVRYQACACFTCVAD